MSLATPVSVQQLQTALYAKAKEASGFRFYALYDKVYRKDVLAFAYQCCKANGGVAGVDGQTFEEIEADGVERWLDELAQVLKSRKLIDRWRRGGFISPSRTEGSASKGYPPSGVGWRKPRQGWCSNRFSRRPCSRNSMPIDVTPAHWTQ